MPYIKVDIGKIKSYQQSISSIRKHVGNIADDVEYDRKKLDSDVKNRNGIDSSLKKINNSLNSYEAVLKKMNSFLLDVPDKYRKCENRIRDQIDPDYNLSFDVAWIKLIKLGSPLTGIGEKAEIIFAFFKTGAKTISDGFYTVKSFFHKQWEEQGVLYRTVKCVGAAVSVVAGVATLVAAIAGTGFTAGLGAPVTVLIGAYGANQAISGLADMYNLIFGDVDKVGEVNLLKSGVSAITGEVGSWFGHEDVGEKVGEVVYTIGSVATAVVSLSRGFGKIAQGKTSASTLKESWDKAKNIASEAIHEVPKVLGEIGYFLTEVPVGELAYQAKLFSYTIPNIMDIVSEVKLVKDAYDDAKDIIDTGADVINIVADEEIVKQPAFLDKLEDGQKVIEKVDEPFYKKIEEKIQNINNNIKVVELVY